MKKLRVVIVGGGFAGVKAALELENDSRFSITLVSSHPNFRYYGTLYQVTTGGSKDAASIPLEEIFEGKRVRVVIGRVNKLEREKRLVITEKGGEFPYDALILGLGVKTNYFNIKGLEEYSFGIKTLTDAEELKRHLHNQLIEQHKPDFHYVVVGGGPTGIELAGTLGAYIQSIARRHGLGKRKIHIDLIEAAPRLLPRMPKDVGRRVARQLRRRGVKLYLGNAVQAQTADALMVNNKPIRSHTVVWTAGMSNNYFFADNNFQLAANGRVRTDQFLQAEKGIYVLGDNADTPYSGMAQTALLDGKYLAQNLKRLADQKEPVPYIAKKPIYVIPAGPKWAAVLWGSVRIYGRLGWWLRRAADLVAYHDYEPWLKAVKHWMADNDKQEPCLICAEEITPNALNDLSGRAAK